MNIKILTAQNNSKIHWSNKTPMKIISLQIQEVN